MTSEPTPRSQFPFARTARAALWRRLTNAELSCFGGVEGSARAQRKDLTLKQFVDSTTGLRHEEVRRLEKRLNDFGLFMASQLPGARRSGRQVFRYLLDADNTVWYAELTGPGGPVQAVYPVVVYDLADEDKFDELRSDKEALEKAFGDVDATKTDERRQEIAEALAPILARAKALAEAQARLVAAKEELCAAQKEVDALKNTSA